MSRVLALALGAALAALLACASDDRVAGKGVITETTNGPAARGRVRTPDSVEVVSGVVSVVRADDVPEAWEGKVRRDAVVDAQGRYQVDGLVVADLELFARVRDAKGRELQGKIPFAIGSADTLIDLPDLQVRQASVLQGVYGQYDSVTATLPEGWLLRVVVRSLGSWMFLDSLGGWRFDNVANGTWRVRIQKVDGVPGHETTLWEGDVVAP